MKSALGHTLSMFQWIQRPDADPYLRVYAYCGNGFAGTGGRELCVVETDAPVEFEDGRLWHHVSASCSDRTPSWEQMALVKATFLGNRTALQIMPPKEKHINIHTHTLHLWACIDDDSAGLPDFGRYGTI